MEAGGCWAALKDILDLGITQVSSGPGSSDWTCRLQPNVTGAQEVGVNQTHIILDSLINSCSWRNA